MLKTVLVAALLCAALTAHAADYHIGEKPIFGTYSRDYQDRAQLRRWQELCKGGGRYQAMSEAYEARKPDPCNGAKEWRR